MGPLHCLYAALYKKLPMLYIQLHPVKQLFFSVSGLQVLVIMAVDYRYLTLWQ